MKMLKIICLLMIYIGPSISAFADEQKASKLSDAYQREYIYLTHQKRNLIKSKEQTLSQLKKDLRIINSDVEKKNLSLSQLENLILKKNSELESYQELVNQDKTTKKKLESLSEQAKETLQSFGYTQPEDLSIEDSLKFSFTKSEDLLQSIDSVTHIKKDVFDIKGQKVQADLYQFGLIATMSADEDDTKTLAPAGLGQLKVIGQTPKYDPFQSLDLKQSQPFFIYDSLAKTYEPKTAKSIKDILKSGGVIGYVILIFGLFALAVAIKRYTILRSYDFSESLKQKLITDLKERRSKANSTKADNKEWSNHLALGPLYQELKYPNIKSTKIEAENIISSIDQKISSYGPVLLGIAAVAPLLGLLGTVTGMIATFDVISEIGTGNPKMLSGGISAALVTTEFGLIVAIPCLLLGNWLNSWSKRISRNLYDIFDTAEEEV